MKDGGHRVILGDARPHKEDDHDAYQALQTHVGAWRQRGPQPNVRDNGVIAVALMVDTVVHGPEALGLALLRQ